MCLHEIGMLHVGIHFAKVHSVAASFCLRIDAGAFTFTSTGQHVLVATVLHALSSGQNGKTAGLADLRSHTCFAGSSSTKRSVLQLQPAHALLSSRRTGQLFRAFKEAVSLIKKCRQLRQACKQARKVKLHNLMQGLEAASLRNDFYSLYKQIRSLAPKSQRRRAQVRDKDGNALGPSAEHDFIVEHFRQLFKDSTHSARRLESACYISFDSGSFAKGFSRLKYDTAVPPGCAPTAAWKAVSDQATPWLQSCAMHALHTSLNIPTIWSDSWLTLIPKPHKMSRLPGDLRPLGIQEVTGKLVIASIRDQLRDLVHDLTAQYPQYAYMCGRGTDAAISRVSGQQIRSAESV